MSFGERLHALREERRMSQRDLHDASGLSLSHIHYLETNEKPPGPATLRRLTRALNVDEKEFNDP